MLKQCRFCYANVTDNPILSLEKQPSSAQGFCTNQTDARRTIHIDIYQCTACGLVQHLLPAVPYYKNVVRAVAYSDEMKKFRISQFKSLITNFNLNEKPILEIGAGRGEYLDLISSLGCNELYALEHCGRSFEILREKGHYAHQGFLDENFCSIWSIKFDAILTFNFMEHWPNIKEALLKMCNMLSHNGIGLFEVPNFDYMVKNNLYSEFTADHIYYFTKESFRRILSVSGFEVLDLKSVWGDYILSALVRKRAVINLSIMSKKKESDKTRLIKYLSERPGITAVWGAGHQAMSILSLINAQNYVEFIVDSASFKQNKFCPGTGLPIYPPDYLLENTPKTLIIMAAAYSKEILRIASANYQHIEEIRIFDENGLH